MELIRSFERLGKQDAGIAGGKGASLGEMTQAGIPVPPGYVILTGAFERFLDEADLNQELDAILDNVNREEMRSVDSASARIQQLIHSAQMPDDIAAEIHKNFTVLDAEFVAVRSSATAEDGASAAWAGQLDTYLNTAEDKLLENVQKCWASLFTPRAIFYRFEKGMHGQKISVAVVVQKMIQSEVSGIAFSVHPVTEDYNQMIIEAGFGLGEAIVSGQVTPDSYVIEKNPRRIIDINVTYQSRALVRGKDSGNEWRELSEVEGNKPALSDEQALELADIVMRIEGHYGFPCDIEWAFEAGNFFITQSRPITTLSPKSAVPSFVQDFRSVDWVKFIERKQPLFLMTAFIRPEFPMLAEKTGFHFTREFSVNIGSSVAWYRSQKELDACDEYFAQLVLSKDLRLEEWAQKCIDLYAEADVLIERFSRDNARFDVASYDSLMREIENIFMYSAEISFFVLNGIELLMRQGVASTEYEHYVQLFEPLRAQSRYPQVGATVFPVFWQAACDMQKDLTPQLVSYSTPRELHRLFSEGVPLVVGDLHKRQNWCMFWQTSDVGDFEFIYEKEKVNLAILNAVAYDAHELKGTPAYKGVVRGRVRRVTGPDDMHTLQENEILVSIHTNPSLLPAMKICGAIVTDEGGMGCHAAIVSRELKKPCIVGTKFATQVLKDGDMVEVDADKGIIRKI
jgi:phosphohistidine swiveling domain-containing protein